jgi:hypothetical protein
MKVPANISYTEEMLREAIEILEETSRNMAMFQRQRYSKLKRRFDQHESINEDLQKALNGIDTAHDDREEICCE